MRMVRWTLGGAALALAVTVAPACKSAESDAERAPAPPASLENLADDVDVVPHAILVDFKDGTTQAQFDAWEADWGVDLELNSVESADEALTLAVGVDDVQGVLERIRQHPSVEAAEPLMEVRASFTPNDPEYAQQWNLKMIDMPKAWERSRGKGVVVAVLDTGIAYEDHDDFKQVPDLKGVKFVPGYDFVNDDEHANDDHGHGTHVAGTIAQATNNGEGVAGVAFEATLMPVKVLNHFGGGTTADIADAIRFAADKGANVINMSLGGGGYSQVMANAVEYARKKGVTVVAAAGNGGRARVEFPAAYPGAVAVSAVGPEGSLAPYSSYGKELDIAAPGGDKRKGDQGGILQNTIDPRDPSRSVYASYQGTSMATPHVAAVAAMLYAAGAKTPDAVEKALYAGAAKVADQAWTEQYGHGLLNAEASLASLGGGMSRWPPLYWALGLLAFVLLTLRGRERPGYLNALLRPAFLVPLLLSTVGVYFVRTWFVSSADVTGSVVEMASLPIPDWERIIFGRRTVSPLFYSALIPVLLSLPAIGWKGLRPAVGGLALGFAGFLAYSAWAGAPALSWMPFTFLAKPWLGFNTVLCIVVARAMLKKEDVP
ncbi:peptidase S8 [Myxococcus sp. CA051A]|uniref:S8 family serine peptidase n=1 Tax=unclassified Myxococcus TaxID=2648731 RepID=UPI00157AE97B|nr:MULTISPECIES: S8 family serine peptidase [unclassified Myxococcus]NTX07893.1 peptidase S8 [Myxococcus sp. CA040A]NTX14876.1 peptidase S8 [Myxococcus sp. CA056]NTX40690.1 peptidase S8 [Myxococcus sp. CA033]NTX51731.1 peptidase S8 [Myxococcus sp. CA039A]NTX66710.1 peptidase S8 [Myxococcus sp. CA051A]